MTMREPSHLRHRHRRPSRARVVVVIALALVAASALLVAPNSIGKSGLSRGEGLSAAAQPAGATSGRTSAVGRAARWRRPARTTTPTTGVPADPVSPPTPLQPSASAEGSAVGVQLHGMWNDYSDAQRLAVLDKIAAAHLRWVRIDMGWSSFQDRCRSCYNSWYLDRANFVVDGARQRGLKVLVTAWRTPGWANGGAGELAPPTNPADFGSFMAWLAGASAAASRPTRSGTSPTRGTSSPAAWASTRPWYAPPTPRSSRATRTPGSCSAGPSTTTRTGCARSIRPARAGPST